MAGGVFIRDSPLSSGFLGDQSSSRALAFQKEKNQSAGLILHPQTGSGCGIQENHLWFNEILEDNLLVLKVTLVRWSLQRSDQVFFWHWT